VYTSSGPPLNNGGKLGRNDRSSIYSCGIKIKKINQNVIAIRKNVEIIDPFFLKKPLITPVPQSSASGPLGKTIALSAEKDSSIVDPGISSDVSNTLGTLNRILLFLLDFK